MRLRLNHHASQALALRRLDWRLKMHDLKNQKEPQPPIKMIDCLGTACFLSLMFLPFSREFWAFVIGTL